MSVRFGIAALCGEPPLHAQGAVSLVRCFAHRGKRAIFLGGGWLCRLCRQDTYRYEVSEWFWSSDLLTSHDV